MGGRGCKGECSHCMGTLPKTLPEKKLQSGPIARTGDAGVGGGVERRTEKKKKKKNLGKESSPGMAEAHTVTIRKPPFKDGCMAQRNFQGKQQSGLQR